MKIKTAEFVISAAKLAQCPTDNLPEIALIGRSNVGKSSLINKMLNRRALARTSSTPGKTRLLNFFRINDCCYWVDLPGYGYARVSKSMRGEWQKLIEGYLKQRESLRGVIQLVDLRHPPTADDVQMYQWFQHYNRPTILVATKADKISRGQWARHLQVIRKTLEIGPEVPVIVFSSANGTGVPELAQQIERLLQQ